MFALVMNGSIMKRPTLFFIFAVCLLTLALDARPARANSAVVGNRYTRQLQRGSPG